MKRRARGNNAPPRPRWFTHSYYNIQIIGKKIKRRVYYLYIPVYIRYSCFSVYLWIFIRTGVGRATWIGFPEESCYNTRGVYRRRAFYIRVRAAEDRDLPSSNKRAGGVDVLWMKTAKSSRRTLNIRIYAACIVLVVHIYTCVFLFLCSIVVFGLVGKKKKKKIVVYFVLQKYTGNVENWPGRQNYRTCTHTRVRSEEKRGYLHRRAFCFKTLFSPRPCLRTVQTLHTHTHT